MAIKPEVIAFVAAEDAFNAAIAAHLAAVTALHDAAAARLAAQATLEQARSDMHRSNEADVRDMIKAARDKRAGRA